MYTYAVSNHELGFVCMHTYFAIGTGHVGDEHALPIYLQIDHLLFYG